jgi:phosphonate transport system substrate-binding protein
VVATLLLPTLVAGCGAPSGRESTSPPAGERKDAPVLRISAIPDQAPEKLNRLYPLVADELSSRLGVTVTYVPVVDYTAAVSAFRTGDLDLVWFGGLTGVQARLQTPGALVIAQRDIDPRFHSVFIANSGSGLRPIDDVQGLRQLKGRRVTFGSQTSTSGTLMPTHFLSEAGVSPDQFAGGAPGYSGSHDATIALVQSGSYEAGALNEKVWLDSLEDGKADPSKVVVLWRTPPYPDYHWIARGDLDQRFGAGFSKRLSEAILSWSPEDPEQRQILELFSAERFIPARAADYATIEKIGRKTGKIR